MSLLCWSVPESEFRAMTPLRARDLIVECFYQAQHETFERAKHRVSKAPADAESIRKAVIAAVRVAFKEVGGDFEKPTPSMLAKVVEVLAAKSDAWGTPEDVIAHHRAQIERILIALGAPSR